MSFLSSTTRHLSTTFLSLSLSLALSLYSPFSPLLCFDPLLLLYSSFVLSPFPSPTHRFPLLRALATQPPRFRHGRRRRRVRGLGAPRFPVVAAANPPDPRDDPKPFEGIGESFLPGTIEPDYFAPDHARVLSEEDDGGDEGGVDSDNPSSADPDSDSRYEVGSVGEWVSDRVGVASRRNRSLIVRMVENHGLDERRADEEVENHGLDERRDDDSEPFAEVDAGNGSSEIASVDGGEKRIAAWWKMPLVLMKYFAFRVKPLWSISVAAAILGLVMLGRRMYKMKRKSRNIPLKIVIDDGRESLLAARAARLNKAFSCVRGNPNYGDALEKSILFFQGQRSGRLPPDQQIKWRSNSGLSDGSAANVV
uniref:cellulase n=1 Tax=Ananas comosus var. bracteatus TaxID=296719 RepID=A0A6V7QH61_ANACO|nr:unnamed protein product [Ananas comosus var. bracteatus]